ncbi:MAG: oligosaccharide flippase family protein [Deltaproteobacteria bacterium]
MVLRQLLSESFNYGLSALTSGILSMLLVPIYTRVFSPDEYGILGLITSTMVLLSILAVMSLDNSAHRWYWETEDEPDRMRTLATWTWCQLVVASFLAGLIVLLSPWLASVLVKRHEAALYFRLAGMTLPLSVLNMVALNWFRMRRRTWGALGFSVSTSLFNFILTIILVVFLDHGLAGVYWSQLATFALGTASATLLMGKWVAPRSFQWDRLKEMLRYSGSLIPAGLASWSINLSGRYFIQGFSSTAEVGVYQVGTTLASGVALVTGAFQLAWGPFAMSIHQQADAKKVYADVLLIYLWVSCLISMTVWLFAPEVLSLMATRSYLKGTAVVGILAFNYVVIGLGYIASIGPTIIKTTRPYGTALLVAGGLTVILNLLLVPRFGKEGAAIATLLAQVTVPIYVFYHSQRIYPIPYRFGIAIAIFLFAFALSFLGSGLPITNFYWLILVKILILLTFLFLLFLLRILKMKDLRRLLTNPRAF